MAVAATLAVSVVLLAGPGESQANVAKAPPTANSAVANQLMKDLMHGEYDRIYQRLSSELQDAVSRNDFKETLSKFTEGVESFIRESKLEVNGLERYVWLDNTRAKGITAALDARGTVIGFQVLNLASYPETDNVSTVQSYAFPFQGEWLVFWGGGNELINYHYAQASQRYAVDWVQTRHGYSYEGDPAKNESYYAFGEEVLTPADGTVVAVVNNIPDNTPVGARNTQQPLGNYVVIDHREHEYSILAHFQHGSIKVSAGDRVAQGDLLGLCGNSGNSSEPHIHFQISDSADLTSSKSVPVLFEGNPLVIQGQTNAVFRRVPKD
jgi:hypothetical protein